MARLPDVPPLGFLPASENQPEANRCSTVTGGPWPGRKRKMLPCGNTENGSWEGLKESTPHAEGSRLAGGKLMAMGPAPRSRNTCVSGQPRNLHQHLWNKVLTAAMRSCHFRPKQVTTHPSPLGLVTQPTGSHAGRRRGPEGITPAG